ncbi:hypothetical protein F383_34946 [Gossypium arboreum]|uniref:Uncharacterized protein n=1 Tax=Gossypium arboreum TaxID=29729 RepID=A0A0B0PQ40_GOSAR|nr:hypothetical protein F383_34946 [Gossypium arboreum]
MDQIEKMAWPKPCHTGSSHARQSRHTAVTQACPC